MLLILRIYRLYSWYKDEFSRAMWLIRIYIYILVFKSSVFCPKMYLCISCESQNKALLYTETSKQAGPCHGDFELKFKYH
jgi:hypothetical protein